MGNGKEPDTSPDKMSSLREMGSVGKESKGEA
jgi:hypothetical protein